MKRPCLKCGKPTGGTYCPTHRLPPPTYQDTQHRRATVAAHVAIHGWWCPGYQKEGHPSTDLTADHITPRSVNRGIGKEDGGGPLRVLCRSCNSRRGDGPA